MNKNINLAIPLQYNKNKSSFQKTALMESISSHRIKVLTNEPAKKGELVDLNIYFPHLEPLSIQGEIKEAKDIKESMVAENFSHEWEIDLDKNSNLYQRLSRILFSL
ncbi:MAG: hypothetical protein NC822_01955 [Candidatus Omnitrophica bacterium]|nr:hypothetical protein [Candidatus Omnitrophota bacterium]MCM8827132.1 hypothetical protein [Candidatus Omnitrophota bacterium]